MSRVAVIDLSKYPFLVDIKEFVRRRYGPGVALRDVISWEHSGELVKNAYDLLIRAIKGVEGAEGLSGDERILAFYVAVLLASAVGSTWLASRFAVYVSKRCYTELLGEEPEALAAISRRLGLPVHPAKEPLRIPVAMRKGRIIYYEYPYYIAITDYLKAERLLYDPSWKLVNQPVVNGRVYLTKRRAARILAEVVANKVLEMVKPIELDELGLSHIRDYVEELRKLVGERVGRGGTGVAGATAPSTVEGIVVEAFPPCIADIYQKALSGANLPHHARFALATFLLNIGASVDEVIDVFRRAPDFKESIARYQVEHLAGLRGSRKKYLTYNCSTMRTLGLCLGDCGVKNPLVEYRRRLRRLKLSSKKTGEGKD